MFKNAAGGTALETLVLAAAYCVSYHEAFAAGDVGNEPYLCYRPRRVNPASQRASGPVRGPAPIRYGKNPSAASCGSSHWPGAPWAAFMAANRSGARFWSARALRSWYQPASQVPMRK